MAYPLGHVGVGVTATVVLLFVTGAYRFRAALFVALLGGAWALVPDLHLVFASLEPLHFSPLADLFFFHRLLDTVVDPVDSWAFAGFAFCLALLSCGALTAAQYAVRPGSVGESIGAGGERRDRTSR